MCALLENLHRPCLVGELSQLKVLIRAKLWCVLLGIILQLLAGFGAAAHASNRVADLTQFKIDTWQTEQGLPQNTVQTMYQSKSGQLWIGTAYGLVRFDGLRFSTLENVAPPELATRSIFGLMEDVQGNMWIAHGGGASRSRNAYGQVFEPAFDPSLTAGRSAWAFAQAPQSKLPAGNPSSAQLDNTVWAATDNGLIRWRNGEAKRYGVGEGLPTNRLRTLAFDRDGTLWIGTTGGGLVSFSDEKFKVFNPSNGFPHLEVRSVMADPAGGIWAATAGGGSGISSASLR